MYTQALQSVRLLRALYRAMVVGPVNVAVIASLRVAISLLAKLSGTLELSLGEQM